MSRKSRCSRCEQSSDLVGVKSIQMWLSNAASSSPEDSRSKSILRQGVRANLVGYVPSSLRHLHALCSVYKPAMSTRLILYTSGELLRCHISNTQRVQKAKYRNTSILSTRFRHFYHDGYLQ